MPEHSKRTLHQSNSPPRPQTAHVVLQHSRNSSEQTLLNRAQQRPRPRTAGFKPSPFDQLLIAEQRSSSPLLTTTDVGDVVSNSKQSSSAASDNVDASFDDPIADELDELDIKEDDGDDDNPFEVIEKSIKAAKSQQNNPPAKPESLKVVAEELSKGDLASGVSTVIEGSEDDDQGQSIVESSITNSIVVSARERKQRASDTSKLSLSMRSTSESFPADEVEFEELVLGDRIGVGGFAEVYKGKKKRRTLSIIQKRLLQ